MILTNLDFQHDESKFDEGDITHDRTVSLRHRPLTSKGYKSLVKSNNTHK